MGKGAFGSVTLWRNKVNVDYLCYFGYCGLLSMMKAPPLRAVVYLMVINTHLMSANST